MLMHSWLTLQHTNLANELVYTDFNHAVDVV
jgi:hypothetical protein